MKQQMIEKRNNYQKEIEEMRNNLIQIKKRS